MPSAPGADYNEFFDRSYRRLCQIAMVAGAGWHEAEDAVQTAMADLARRWHEVGKPFPYARRAVLNCVMKTKSNDKKLEHRLQERGHGVPECDPDSSMIIWEDQEWVNQLLDSLTADQREILTHILAGLSCKEVARLIGKTDATVRQHLRNARLRLQEHEDIVWRPPIPSKKEEGQ